MKIKLAVLDQDKNYLSRLVSAFAIKYSDKLEAYSFTNQAMAMESLKNARIDVFVASDAFDIDFNQIPNRCGFAYLVDFNNADSINDRQAICKFQKVDLIYKQILSIYSEIPGNLSSVNISDEKCKIIAFASPSGGTGSSTAAAACALHYAQRGVRTLYLNFEKFGSSNVFFDADGTFDMGDIIYALKKKRTNLSMKLESCVRQDPSGVCFYSQPKIARDMLELTPDDIIRLINEIKLSGSYDYMVIDMEFGLDKGFIDIFTKAHRIIVTGDGSEISNLKISRAYNALIADGNGAEMAVAGRMLLLYNKFSNKSSRAINNIEIKNIGGIPKYEHATTRQVLGQISGLSFFDKIV